MGQAGCGDFREAPEGMLLASFKDIIIVGKGSEGSCEDVTSQAFEPGVDEKSVATASQSRAVSCQALPKGLPYNLANVTFFR